VYACTAFVANKLLHNERLEQGGRTCGGVQCNNHLVKVEYRVGIDVLARNRLGPELLHEEHLVREL